MKEYKNLYETLGLKQNASPMEIKSRFRTLALKHHPDKNNNGKTSEIIFKIIYNAYATLISPEKRKAYDIYLKTCTIYNTSQKVHTINSLHTHINHDNEFLDNLCFSFNFIFWEVEDLVQIISKKSSDKTYDGFTVEQWLLKILIFFDRWVLTPAGFEDYFFTSRKIYHKKSFNYLDKKFMNSSHLPYVNINDYFYEIRKRLDAFINKITADDVVKKVDGYDVTIVDNMLEAQRYSYHYLGLLNLAVKNPISSFSNFQFSNKCYDTKRQEMIFYSIK